VEAQPGGGDDSECALGADQEALEVIARLILSDWPADRDELTRRKDRLDPGDPAAGHAVLKCVRPARVRRDVAADLRLFGCAWVRREVETVLAREAAHVTGANAGLDVDPPEQRVEGTDAGQPLEADDHPAVDRHRSARIAGAASPRDDRRVVLVAPGDDRGNLLGGARKDDRIGSA
jgi:hypothetical protein